MLSSEHWAKKIDEIIERFEFVAPLDGDAKDWFNVQRRMELCSTLRMACLEWQSSRTVEDEADRIESLSDGERRGEARWNKADLVHDAQY